MTRVEVVNDGVDVVQIVSAAATWGGILVAILAAFFAPRWIERKQQPEGVA